jgi:hypothetical protein
MLKQNFFKYFKYLVIFMIAVSTVAYLFANVEQLTCFEGGKESYRSWIKNGKMLIQLIALTFWNIVFPIITVFSLFTTFRLRVLKLFLAAYGTKFLIFITIISIFLYPRIERIGYDVIAMSKYEKLADVINEEKENTRWKVHETKVSVLAYYKDPLCKRCSVHFSKKEKKIHMESKHIHIVSTVFFRMLHLY